MELVRLEAHNVFLAFSAWIAWFYCICVRAFGGEMWVG